MTTRIPASYKRYTTRYDEDLYRGQRLEILHQTWDRFAAAMVEAGNTPPPRPVGNEAIARKIRSLLLRGMAPSFRWAGAIEYNEVMPGKGAQVGLELELTEPEPSRTIVGTQERIDAMADRAARGEELFCDRDGVCEWVRDW